MPAGADAALDTPTPNPSPQGGGESRIQREYQPVQPTYAQTTVTPGTRAKKPSLDDMGPGTDRPEPQRDADAVSRIRKPTLDEMGSHSNRPIPARGSPSPRTSRGEGHGGAVPPARGEGRQVAPRAPDIDPRTKAGAYGEQVKGPHKPTLDEMGPHAERGLPVSGKPLPPKPRISSPPPGGEGGAKRRVGGNSEGTSGFRPARTIEVFDETEKKKHRHGRPRKTGRPGQ